MRREQPAGNEPGSPSSLRMSLTRTATIHPVDKFEQAQSVVLTDGEPSAVTLVLEVVRKRSEYWAAVTPAEVGEGPSFMLDVASMRRLVVAWQTMDC